MKIKFITWASDDQHPGWLRLKRSLKDNGWDYQLLTGTWRGYASKMLGIYHYLLNTPTSIDLVVISDSYDSIVMATPEEVLEKYKEKFDGSILCYAERACWPYSEEDLKTMIGKEYPKAPDTIFQFVNGGGVICTPQQYIDYMQMDYPSYDPNYNDQLQTTKLFLERNDELNMRLDNYCDILQCAGHANEGEFSFEDKRVINNITHTTPCIIHFNGHSFNDPLWSPLLEKYSK